MLLLRARAARPLLRAISARRCLSTATRSASSSSSSSSEKPFGAAHDGGKAFGGEGGAMAEFERLENSALAPLLRLVGTFSDAQRQSAAGCDMFVHCASQAARPEFYAADGGGLDGARYAQKVQLVGVHCWLCHVRLREEPKERYDKLFYEMMEKQWEQVQLDLSRGGPAGLEEGMGFIELSGYLKDLQTGWHGLAVKLDNAIGVGVPKAADGGEAAAGEAAASETPPPPTMHGALLRNVYADGDGALPAGADAAAHRLAAYVELQLDHLRSLPADDVLAGRISWAPWPSS